MATVLAPQGRARPAAGGRCALRPRCVARSPGRRFVGRRTPARRDIESAGPGRAHPDPRRAHRRADAAGKRSAVQDARPDGGGRPVDYFHQSQAGRGPARVRQNCRAARRCAGGRGAGRRYHPGRAGPVDGWPGRSRAAAPACSLGRRRGVRAGRGGHGRHRSGAAARFVAGAASRRDHGDCRRVGQRPTRAGRTAVRHARGLTWQRATRRHRVESVTGLAGGAGGGAHSRRPSRRGPDRRPERLGERGVRTAAQPGVLGLGADPPPKSAGARRVDRAHLRCARRRTAHGGTRPVGRKYAKADSGARPVRGRRIALGANADRRAPAHLGARCRRGRADTPATDCRARCRRGGAADLRRPR